MRYLLFLVGAIISTAAAAFVVFHGLATTSSDIRQAAESIAAGKPYYLQKPIGVRNYTVFYRRDGGRWILDKTGEIQLYALGLGNCPAQLPDSFYGESYGPNNATWHFTDCSIILPHLDGGKFTHYLAMCTVATDFKPEITELEVQATIRLIVVC